MWRLIGLIWKAGNVWVSMFGASPSWCLHCTFITRNEWFCPALKCWRNDGAVSMWKDVLWVVVNVFPTVSASLWEKSRREKQIQTHAHPAKTNTSICERASPNLWLFKPHPHSAGVSASLWLSNDHHWEGELKPIHNPDHKRHGLWCKYLNWSLRSVFPRQH